MNATAKTIEEVIAEERAAHAKWESETVAANVGGRDYTIAEFHKIADRVFNPENWKAAWAAAVPADLVAAVCAAVCHYHGRYPRVEGIEPVTGRVLMAGDGYACY